MRSLPIYSICIPNLNMEHTIEKALRSVLNQIDNRYEVIVVDDGSTDRSLEILERLETEYRNLRVFALPKEKERTLAQTRNISVSYARGKYLILHIDCDDYWYPYINDFVEVYHQIEKFKGGDFLLSGQQINMGRTDFLRKHGPYKYGHMVEDRDLWYRMAKLNKWIPLDHVVFRERMTLTREQIFRKKYFLTARIMRDEISYGRRPISFIKDLFRTDTNQNLKYRLLKVGLLPIALIGSVKKGFLPQVEQQSDWPSLKKKAWEKSGTAAELFNKHGHEFDFSKLSPEGRKVFLHSASSFSLSDIPSHCNSD